MTDSTNSSTPGLAWEQLSLLGPEVIELHLRIGVVPASDHLQWQLEVRDMTGGGLLGMLSSPHVSATRWPHQLGLMVDALKQTYENHVSPF